MASTLAWKLNIRRRWNRSIIGDIGHVLLASISSNWAIERALARPEGGQEVIVVNWWRIAFLLQLQTCQALTAEGRGGRDATVETRISATATWECWGHNRNVNIIYQRSNALVFQPHHCWTSLLTRLGAQLWTGRSQVPHWHHWTAGLVDAGSLAFLGRPAFSHEGGIWPPHLKDPRKVWAPSLVVSIVMDTAGGGSILPVFADRCFTECGRWSIRLKEGGGSNEEIWRGEGRQAASSEHTLVCQYWHKQSKSITSQLENAAAEFSPLLGLLDLNRVFEDIVPGESATQPVKKTKAQNL